MNGITIEIRERIYNGKYSRGSRMIYANKFTLKGNNANIGSCLEFCIDDEIKNSAKTIISIPFIMGEKDLVRLKQTIDYIKSNSQYLYNESHYDKTKFDRKRYNYTDVIINNKAYEISNSDVDVLTNLQNLMHCNLSDDLVNEVYYSCFMEK